MRNAFGFTKNSIPDMYCGIVVQERSLKQKHIYRIGRVNSVVMFHVNSHEFVPFFNGSKTRD